MTFYIVANFNYIKANGCQNQALTTTDGYLMVQSPGGGVYAFRKVPIP